MPYKSKTQLGFMHAKHPEIVKRWDKEYDSGYIKSLPEHIKRSKKTSRSEYNKKNLNKR